MGPTSPIGWNSLENSNKINIAVKSANGQKKRISKLENCIKTQTGPPGPMGRTGSNVTNGIEMTILNCKEHENAVGNTKIWTKSETGPTGPKWAGRPMWAKWPGRSGWCWKRQQQTQTNIKMDLKARNRVKIKTGPPGPNGPTKPNKIGIDPKKHISP